MSEMPSKLASTIRTALAIFALVGALCAATQAQSTRPITTSPPIDVEKSSSDEARTFASLEEEMRAKRAIRSAEKEYQTNLDRARELSFLTQAVISSYERKEQLNREDLKKLEKAEKLAKGIREAAGGSEDNGKMEKPPQTVATALTMLGELSESLKGKVEKTPKHVVSTAVIDEANVLLEVIRIVRSLSAKV